MTYAHSTEALASSISPSQDAPGCRVQAIPQGLFEERFKSVRLVTEAILAHFDPEMVIQEPLRAAPGSNWSQDKGSMRLVLDHLALPSSTWRHPNWDRSSALRFKFPLYNTEVVWL